MKKNDSLRNRSLRGELLEDRLVLSAALGADVAAVSVKGKTNEGMDAVGAGRGIAVHCVVLLAFAESNEPVS